MVNENDPVIGYGIIDTDDPMYLGKGGYGFLLRQSNRESAEELKEWFTRVTREYQLANPALKFVTCYCDSMSESAIKHEMESHLLHLNASLRISMDVGYHMVTWATIRSRLELDKSLEEAHQRTGGTFDDYEPLSI